MCAPLARPDYYRTSALPDSLQLATSLPTTVLDRQREGDADSSHVHMTSINQVGGQLYPDSLATPTPQAFSVASPPTDSLGYGVDHPPRAAVRCVPALIHQV
jgi:hypothetical protein